MKQLTVYTFVRVAILSLFLTADAIAEEWIHEFNFGIEGTGIKPGFIKIGVDRTDTLSIITSP